MSIGVEIGICRIHADFNLFRLFHPPLPPKKAQAKADNSTQAKQK